MKLFVNPMSPPCRRVMATMYHLNSPCELQNVDFQSKQLEAPEFRKLNPNGAIPTLQDGDYGLWESCAIMQYLCEKKGTTDLWPSETKARAEVTKWSYWTAYHMGPACGTLMWEGHFKKAMGMGEPDTKAIAEATEDFHKYAKVLDDHLAKNQWATGKTMTLADFTLGSAFMYADAAKMPWDKYANVRAWYKRLEGTDAWKKSTPPQAK
jgi:glutathione S-transferase